MQGLDSIDGVKNGYVIHWLDDHACLVVRLRLRHGCIRIVRVIICDIRDIICDL